MAILVLLISTQVNSNARQGDSIYFRINQVGYKPLDVKKAIIFSNSELNEKIFIADVNSGEQVEELTKVVLKDEVWGNFQYYYEVDFSNFESRGTFQLESESSGYHSSQFNISATIYQFQADRLLEFMQQQRCGYNPFFEVHCHQKDGVVFYGEVTPDSSFVDATGGWHDAGDMLKYLITSSYATAHMLMSFELYPDAFSDKVDAFGRSGSNGLPDILDEAKWGLDWILKLHPNSKELIHQVADDRDHIGYKFPDKDPADYGWGGNNYRVAYFADGYPQGLHLYKSSSTGISNIAGRSAAAMALAYRIWKNILKDEIYAAQCLAAAKSLYHLGKVNEGYQQGNSFGAPYRYNEKTWADDMEWAAPELYKATKEIKYLKEAKTYARMAAEEDSWIKRFANGEDIEHYELYPYVNMGHFSLFHEVDEEFKDELAGYYEAEIRKAVESAHSPYDVGYPFIWCSNNLATGLITQIILYEEMTGDKKYNDFMVKQRDWLLGRNPWGTSMFTGFPENGDYPVDVHTSTWMLTGREVVGGLVDGPVHADIYNSLIGIQLSEQDEYDNFQNSQVVYHDDSGDYSTNEPTMDGTAGAILMFAKWASSN
ncbi:glycoside hydrolase family 9 protein [Portibacter marinus]|uniref:glycoside hydrolase family 9 protein n=1 Tax=Portibacter marinus TaxID=2898660 RepID=UPI001F204952|nr:glycoside hydrolase family 9 protein [Portibacter marinus]